MNRVDFLADREVGFVLKDAPKVKHLIPLMEIIADVLGVGTGSKAVLEAYMDLVNNFKNEFKVLLGVSQDELEKVVSPEIALGIINVREGKVKIAPGYDGVFGKISVDKTAIKKPKEEQASLF